jgi:hypothetical protein
VTALPPPVALFERHYGIPEGSLDGPDRARAEEYLQDATALVLAEAPASVAARWELDVPRVVLVRILKATRREFENPQGLRSENLGEHGFSVDTASGVYFTADERAAIRRAATGRSGGFTGSVRTPSPVPSITPPIGPFQS